MTLGMLAAIWLAVASAQSSSTRQPEKVSPQAGRLEARAEEARRSNRTEEAITLYKQALASRPRWAEGWWSLGTLLYDQDAYADAAVAFEKATALDPKAGTAWVMRGLCEFRLGRHDEALRHIQRGRALGVSADPQFRHVMLYHEGLLLLGKAEFERAQETLARLSADGVDSEELSIALGLSVLRVRPSDLPAGESMERRMVRRAGHAAQLAARKQFDAAQREYEQLAGDFPKEKNVYYALGRYFVETAQPDQAAAAYQREIENTPDHVPARLGIAAIKAETDPAAALSYAEAAVALNPRIPLGHYLLGSLLLHTDDTARAIAELETAQRAVPQDPGVYYALGRAYARAQRTADAARARATFKRLTEEQQRAAQRSPGEPSTDGRALP